MVEFAVIHNHIGPEAIIAALYRKDFEEVIRIDEADTNCILSFAKHYTIDARDFEPMFKEKANTECPPIIARISNILTTVFENVANGSHLYIVPDDDLWYIPWTALQDSHGNFLVDKYYFHIIPSIRVAHLLKLETAQRKDFLQGPFLFVNPGTTRKSAEEQIELHKIIGNVFHPLEGTAADVDSFLEEVKKASIVHVVTHGRKEDNRESVRLTFDGDHEFDPLRLEDSTASGLRLVTIAACQSAKAVYCSDGISGFAGQFWRMKVPSLILTLWNISDEHTVEFSKQFYTQLFEKKESPDIAFGNTVRIVRTKFPFKYWAAFQFWGI